MKSARELAANGEGWERSDQIPKSLFGITLYSRESWKDMGKRRLKLFKGLKSRYIKKALKRGGPIVWPARLVYGQRAWNNKRLSAGRKQSV